MQGIAAEVEPKNKTIEDLKSQRWEDLAKLATHRDLVLKAVAEGNNLISGIVEITGLSSKTVVYELEMLEGVVITKLPPPPVNSWWIKGEEPKGRIYVSNGKVHVITETNPMPLHLRVKKSKNPVVKAEPAKQIDLSELENAGDYKEIPLSQLEPHPENPRVFVDTEDPSFINLSESIKAAGVQEPLVVTVNAANGKFRIIMGHRRFEAAKLAGLASVPCIIRRYESAEAELVVMLIENIQRQGLQPTQEGKAFHKIYLQSDRDIHAVARKIGLTQGYIMSRMSLLKLDDGIQIMIDRRELSISAGVVLSKLQIPQQKTLVVQAQRMKIPELREVVEKLKTGAVAPPKWKNNKKRVLEPKEEFTRTWAIDSLDKLGEAWFGVQFLKDSFNDVCQDACAQTKDETLCKACPVPRFIASILRRKKREEEK